MKKLNKLYFTYQFIEFDACFFINMGNSIIDELK